MSCLACFDPAICFFNLYVYGEKIVQANIRLASLGSGDASYGHGTGVTSYTYDKSALECK